MNRFARSSLAALLLAAGLGATTVLAQQAPPAPSSNDDGRRGLGGRRGGGDGARADRGARRAEIRERVQQKIQSYLAVELASRAGLDQTKSVQLGSAIKAHMERKQKARQGRREDMEKLRSLVDSKGSDAAVKSQLKSVVEPEGRDLQAFLDDTSKFLTPTEQAKVVLALPEVMKDARQLVREARGNKRRGGGDR